MFTFYITLRHILLTVSVCQKQLLIGKYSAAVQPGENENFCCSLLLKIEPLGFGVQSGMVGICLLLTLEIHELKYSFIVMEISYDHTFLEK